MSIGNHPVEVKKPQQSGDGYDLRLSDSQNDGSEDGESLIVELDDDGYQELHRVDIEDTQPEVGGDISGDSGTETSFQDEVLHIEFNLELDDNTLEVQGGEIDTAQPGIERDITEDLLGIGASFPDDALHLGPALEVE